MRDFFKILIVGIFIAFMPKVCAEDYSLLIIPDNITTENISLDSYIYDSTAEFFADEISTILNTTKYIKVQPVSEIRTKIKSTPVTMLAAKDLTYRFRTTYNINYDEVKKLANITGDRYVLLLTSTIDAENYILRRTWWDFFNIAGASVIDPAYKINTYAVLIDSQNNKKLWADTYYKTISTVENRIITRGPSPQTEQLGKIKDYSHYICPQIAQNVQLNILPPYILSRESNRIDYDLGNIDNVFTKKYRHLGTETGKIFANKKPKNKTIQNQPKSDNTRAKKVEQKTTLEVKAVPVKEEKELNKINSTVKESPAQIKSTVYKTNTKNNQSLFDPIDIKKSRRNNLYGNYNANRPDLRDYTP